MGVGREEPSLLSRSSPCRGEANRRAARAGYSSPSRSSEASAPRSLRFLVSSEGGWGLDPAMSGTPTPASPVLELLEPFCKVGGSWCSFASDP